jgi:hypothetical protein
MRNGSEAGLKILSCLCYPRFGSSPFRVGDFHGFSGIWDGRGEHLEFQVLGVSDPIGPALNHPDLVVESLHEAEGDLMIGTAIADDAFPMAFYQFDKLLKGLEPAPA